MNMPENKPFIITDKRKFTMEGDLRQDAEASHAEEQEAALPVETPPATTPEAHPEPDYPPPPTAEQTEQAQAAYQATSDRLDTAIRAANPGADHPPAMTFETLVQSVYMTAIVQLGGATPEGQQPQVDLLGARQSIDMLGILAEKTKGNLTDAEKRFLDSALFELRMAFLEITQVIARSAAAKTTDAGPGKPSIVR
jgi:hypothetical protein